MYQREVESSPNLGHSGPECFTIFLPVTMRLKRQPHTKMQYTVLFWVPHVPQALAFSFEHVLF